MAMSPKDDWTSKRRAPGLGSRGVSSNGNLRWFSAGTFGLSLILVALGWLAAFTLVGQWLLGCAVAALIVACATSGSWRTVGWRLAIGAAMFIAFPLLLNAVVSALDAVGIVDQDDDGMKPAGHR